MIFFCGFTCASLPFNLNPISLHIAQIPDGCQRHRRKSTDGFFWKNHEMTVLESCPIPKWGTYMTSWPLCSLSPSPSDLSLSSLHFHLTHVISWPTSVLHSMASFLSVRVWSGLLLQRAGLSSCALGKCTMRATATIYIVWIWRIDLC